MPRRASQRPLASLLYDTGGTTLAMMAAAMIPLAGLVGGGIDVSRLYLAKTRLQQACDAGALAGRKVMGGGLWTNNSGAANAAATTFFDSNFEQYAYGTGARTRAFTEAAGRVSGAASVVVPMTIMRIFGQTQQTLNVICEAEMKLPNTDVMFVLDNSGSMSRTADNVEAFSGANSRIVALRSATKCFYETVSQIDIPTENCGSTPSGGTSNQVQIRFGFVPYGSMVNVGRLLPTNFMADSWTYQTRVGLITKDVVTNVDTPNAQTRTGQEDITKVVNNGNAVVTATFFNVASDADCQKEATVKGYTNQQSIGSESSATNPQSTGSPATRTSQTEQSYSARNNGAFYDSGNRRCFTGYQPVTYTLVRYYQSTDTRTQTTRKVFEKWRYAALPVDVSGLKNGTAWNNSITLPIGNVPSGGEQPSNKVINWNGCIEERKTAAIDPFTSITSNHLDLDIDLVPSASVPGSHWGPSLAGVVYARGIADRGWYSTNWNGVGPIYNEISTTVDYASADGFSPFPTTPHFGADQQNSYHCPAPARKMQTWPATVPAGQLSFSDYVDTLAASGNTFTDVGLMWGARLMSATGLFASENAATPIGGKIERHIIFMTDGDVQAQNNNNTSHGIPWFNRRQNGPGAAPTNAAVMDQVNARTAAICAIVKNQPDTTLWVIGLGSGVSPTTDTRLTTCASGTAPNKRYFPARTNDDLKAAFRSIANSISALKLTS